MEIIDKDSKILREKAKTVPVNDDTRRLAENLFEKLETLEGVGLAAPQVGICAQVAVLEYTRKNPDDDKEIQDIPRLALINPKITWKSRECDVQTEACFSLPKVEIQVTRPKKIHVSFQDLAGKRQKLKAKGFLSRAIQHEVDHLNGILITDYK